MMLDKASRTLAASIALPLAALGALWATAHHGSRRGTDWDVAVSGHDPRDYLRGHYVVFRLEWPGRGADDEALLDLPSPRSGLCLTGRPPMLTGARVLPDRERAGPECVSVVRPIEQPDGGVSLSRSVYFMDQRAAGTVGRAIQERGGIARIRVRDDGLMTVTGLSPNPVAGRP